MKIIEIIFTRNESELLQQNIEFHKKWGVDFFLVTDSSSTDGTKDFMEKLRNSGIAECFHDDNRVMAQKENMERMAIIAKNKYKADWIIVSDTDEFWYPGESFSVYLSKIDSKINTLKVGRFQYFPTELDSSHEKIYNRMLYRETGKGLGFDAGIGDGIDSFARKKIMFRPIHNKIDILAGNHTVHFPGRVVLETHPSDFRIHEYPYRSYSQVEEKIKRAADVFKKNQLFGENKKFATHWRDQLKIYNEGKFKEFYSSNIYFNEARLKKAIEEGILIKDEKLSLAF